MSYNRLTGPYFFQKYIREKLPLPEGANSEYATKVGEGAVTFSRLRHSNPLIRIVNGVLIDLPSPVNFSL